MYFSRRQRERAIHQVWLIHRVWYWWVHSSCQLHAVSVWERTWIRWTSAPHFELFWSTDSDTYSSSGGLV